MHPMNYRTIFTVVNEHTASTVAGRYAIALAAAGPSRLVLYSALQKEASTASIHRAERHLEQLFKEASTLALPVTRITESGLITRLLPLRADAEHTDLVLYPLTPDEQYHNLLRQQPVHTLLRSIRSDLAIMRIIHMGKPHPRRILVPLGRTVAEPASRIRFIAALHASFHGGVILFHLAADTLPESTPGDITRFRSELHRHHVATLERYATGHIGRGITAEAATGRNDLIVLGASERSILRQLFYGNPAGDVMHQPPCNAILFRAGRQPS